MPDKLMIPSNYKTKTSGILPRVNMPHFQHLIMLLDFSQLVVVL